MSGGPRELSADEEHTDAHASNAFTAKLYARLKRAPGNVMISGTSARHALAIAALGARGDTAREMLSTLEAPSDLATQVAAAKAETAAWQDARGTAELVLADRLWADTSLALKDDFTAAASAAFGASAAPVDFANAPDVARRTVNTWVAEKTSNKVHDLLPEGMVDKRTRLLVTDAIYFKARWSGPFTASATKDEPFTTAPGRAAKEREEHREARARGHPDRPDRDDAPRGRREPEEARRRDHRVPGRAARLQRRLPPVVQQGGGRGRLAEDARLFSGRAPPLAFGEPPRAGTWPA